ncbi:hypothetical protein BSK66_08720 [Paenibacillus odorifer]|uniref:Uncharacterized protein n=1 Tax=Paenibacillus odorifer TaxID=189426 RepID=A0A1R0XBA1_9BACL|nr:MULTISPECIES: hypothetical protein [Paenibacillus]ETT64326.1 hypothetical protein C171_08727 [Paenibacillus sp. FSL H8-237]OMD32201.1 hypothetical protein BJP51_16620 [Paenibacillus odorifer]OME61187.1 hypothetical protein BSK66_08720 [Paenibacillus odorifer]
MSKQDEIQFVKDLAELYVRRRNEWSCAIDQVLETEITAANNQVMSSVENFYLADRHQQKASGRWDQMVEFVRLLPNDLKGLVLQEIDRIK